MRCHCVQCTDHETVVQESEKNVRVKQDSAKARGEGRSLDESTMSTSSNLEAFANDDLGIVVHTHTHSRRHARESTCIH